MSEEKNTSVNTDLEDAGNALDNLNKNINENTNEERAPRREGAPTRDGMRPPNKGNFRPGGKKKHPYAKKVCKFTTGQIDPATIDYKNIDLLRRFIMPSGKIVPRRITGTSSKYQRVLAREIKKARIMAFIPFSAR